ncbi:phosphatase PAP2 family protein [Geodermatophilus ruber]|uniref:Undecaprenyl-diphosphatase n=1 Tax=Geodermatophilus ruber TaxID=504800 RepID=A0A1I4L640_9ACTN|nr:phosphatase PAP2 family protein [Geodermatophilus ruber]SFL86339.1 undecaprenyl-diphosphatase [Geodermatophilus ruber]
MTETPVRRLAGTAWILGAALTVLIGWVLVHHRRPLAVDLTLHAAALAHRTPALTTVALAVTGSSGELAWVLAVVGGLLAVRSRPWWVGALAGAAALGLGQLLRLGLVTGIGRARPPAADWAARAGGYALPSGHTTTATLGAGLLCLGLARALRGAWRVAGVAVTACWAVAVGLTRVYLGVHWPTDALGGWLLGTLLTVLAALALLRLAPRRSGRLPGAQRAQQQHESGQL